MPHSVRENDSDVQTFVAHEGIATVLDIGAGSGTYAKVLEDHRVILDAVEGFAPYVEQFGLDLLYRSVYALDVRDLAHVAPEGGAAYDLVIFGDVLEHMPRHDALNVWTWAGQFCRWGLISLPMEHWPQGHVNGNPLEAHDEDHLTGWDLMEPASPFGPFDYAFPYEQTGTFIRRFGA